MVRANSRLLKHVSLAGGASNTGDVGKDALYKHKRSVCSTFLTLAIFCVGLTVRVIMTCWLIVDIVANCQSSVLTRPGSCGRRNVFMLFILH